MSILRVAVALAFLLGVAGAPAVADRNALIRATVEPGQKEVTKNLLYVGPLRKEDRRLVIKSYSIFTSPKNALAYTFVATRLDGSIETFSAHEGRHPNFDRIFAGSLDLRIVRLSDDLSEPIHMSISLWTRSDRENGFP